VHHKPLVGRAPPGPAVELTAEEKGVKGKGGKREEKGMETR